MAKLQNPPVYSSIDIKGVSLATSWKMWFSSLFTFLQNIANYSGNPVQVPVTGFNITIGNSSPVLTLNPAGTLATGTVVMPKVPADGMPVEVSSTQIITSFTLSPSAGQTIKNVPTALAAGIGFAYYYNASLSTWFRRY